jgi:hypothetical protein
MYPSKYYCSKYGKAQKCPYYLVISRFRFCVCRINFNMFSIYFQVGASDLACYVISFIIVSTIFKIYTVVISSIFSISL